MAGKEDDAMAEESDELFSITWIYAVSSVSTHSRQHTHVQDCCGTRDYKDNLSLVKINFDIFAEMFYGQTEKS